MRSTRYLGLTAVWVAAGCGWAQLPVLQRSEVVFMYQASRATYQAYGATAVAWGGRPTEKSLREAEGLKFFGSVGMVTEFSRYHDRFPDRYEEGLCRDVEGQPYRVPWLTDHQHRGIPYWWCCTRQPVFRQYLEERVADTVKAGAQGVHIDDHLGTAGGLHLGGCFCGRCVAGFREYLRGLPEAERARQGVREAGTYDFRAAVREWVAAQPGRAVTGHPLWSHWRIYQFRGAAQFMAELRELAARTAGRPVPMGANACLLWGPHLSDYQSLDLFSAEIPHHAEARRFSDDPLVAYRLAEAVGRPLASTASGHDWAFIKEQNLPGLVQGWVALGYAAGHGLMAPHRQWCYTPEKGTHWYEGPAEKFAPLYRFVREHPELFDGYENHADLTVAYAQRTFERNAARILGVGQQLAAAQLSYRLALGGDAIVDHPLPTETLRQAARLLVIEPDDFLPADRERLAAAEAAVRFGSVEEVLRRVEPAVRAEGGAAVRLLPRVKPGSAVVHVLNWAYDPARDGVVPARDLRVELQLAALGVPGAKEARVFVPGAAPVRVPVRDSGVVLPELGLWAMVWLGGE